MLELRHITKRFGGVAALDDVSISFAERSIHAVLGENGAGKSTLMRVLYGMVQADRGEILLDGRRLSLRRPADAMRAGIGMVHQHFTLVERMTVGENLALGAGSGGWWMSPAGLRGRVEAVSRRVGLEIAPEKMVEELSVGQRQRVEILKALQHDVHTLILDEPTAVLTPQEVEQLSVALRKLRDEGRRVIFISHKLNEVVGLCDAVSVLRGGKLVCTERMGALSADELAERMVGRRVGAIERGGRAAVGEIAVELGAGCDVRRGEIVGIAGVDGNGQAELVERVLSARRAGHIADDRQREALVMSMTVAENAILKLHGEAPISSRGVLRTGVIRVFAQGLVREYDIRTAGVNAGVATLSGGNQQKLVVGRELATRPELIVAVNPTRGLDVAATDFVHRRLLAERERGAAVVLVSVDLDEILALADRVCVIFDGKLTAARAGDVTEIGRLMAGLPAA